MKNLLTIAFVALTVILTGCSTLGGVANKLTDSERLEQVAFGLDVVFLDKEFESAKEALLFNNWTDDERVAVVERIENLQRLKNGTDALLKGRVEGVQYVTTPGASLKLLDDLSENYNALRNLYVNYLAREGLPADPELVAYNNSAVDVHQSMVEYVVDENKGIKVKDFENLLTYVARGFILYKTGGVGI